MEQTVSGLMINCENREGMLLDIVRIVYLKNSDILLLQKTGSGFMLKVENKFEGCVESIIKALEMLPGVHKISEEPVERDSQNRESNQNGGESKIRKNDSEHDSFISLEAFLDEGKTLSEIFNLVEKEILSTTLKNYQSIRKAAKALGVSHTTVINKIKKLKELGFIEDINFYEQEEMLPLKTEATEEYQSKEYFNGKETPELVMEGENLLHLENHDENNAIPRQKENPVDVPGSNKEPKTGEQRCSNCGELLKFGAVFCTSCFSS